MQLNKLLCIFSGDDYNIIRQSDRPAQNRFRAIGACVVAIFVLCFVSCCFTFTKLFRSYYISIPVGIFFSFMITNIYLFLLYTLSKNSFPCEHKKTGIFSIFFRIGFICFIAIIVSKPIETILFSSTLEKEIDVYKQVQIGKYERSTAAYYNNETSNLRLIIEKQKLLYTNSAENQVRHYEEILEKRELEKFELITAMNKLVQDSNYYIQSIAILNTKYRVCWVFTLLIVLIFLLPAYLKNFLKEQNVYYQTKKNIENRLVLEAYAGARNKYNELIKEYNYNGTFFFFSETFVDPPFNTKRKGDKRTFLKEDDLISELYHA